MILTELLPNLFGVRKGGDGYVAKCPAHEDAKPSLSITESEGRILLNCFAGCSNAEIVSALGLNWRDLFDARIKQPSRKAMGDYRVPTPRKADWAIGRSAREQRVHTIYHYRDESGNVVYENVRFHPKDFRQRTFDEKGRPVWNLNGVRRVPYRLPQLIKGIAEDRDVFLCEGEKDTDALRELGFTATNFKNWQPDWNHYLTGKHVIVVTDHDIPGIRQANEVAQTVLRSAASVKVLDVWADRELPEKNGPDISDFIRVCVQDEGLDADLIKERLSLMVDRTERWKNPINAQTGNYFVVQSGNEWLAHARTKPIPKMLFGRFWFEGEVCILFADTNVGKSILAVQIADAISRGGDDPYRTDGLTCGMAADGHSAKALDLKLECRAQKVVYFDFELTSKQFESRFSERVDGADEYTNHYLFHPNFYRAEINPETGDLQGFKDFEELLHHSLDATIESTGAKVLVIDNLTYLKNETENARNALPLMKYLKELKSRYELSILALAHTPKRDASRPLGRNDLQGSKMLINFCDSSFAIGESARDPGLRYLKQIKARNTEIIYSSESVYLARVEKDENFLRFSFEGIGSEHEHLKMVDDQERQANVAKAKQMAESGMRNKDIAAALGVSAMTVTRYLRK